MRWIPGAAILSGAILLQTPMQAQAEADPARVGLRADAPLPVSLDRIRAGLKQPPPMLQAPAPSDDSPTFRVEVREQVLDLQPVDEKPFDLTYGLPSAGELLMRGIGKIQSSIVNYKRGRAERRARKEVEDALAAFFAYNSVPRNTTSATEK
jgi:hypothetical protein